MGEDSKFVKVAVIGTHGTGKTTIVYDIATRLKLGGVNVGIVEEVARTLPRYKGFDINENTNADSQLWILHQQMIREIEAKVRGDNDAAICDRAVLDNYMYLVYNGGRTPARDIMVYDWVKTYDLLVYVPIRKERPLPNNGDDLRAKDPVFQRGIEDLLARDIGGKGIDVMKYKDTPTVIKRIMELLEEKVYDPKQHTTGQEQDN